MLEKYFVPYDRALKLKELGFNDTVDYYYTPNGETRQSCGLLNYPKKLYPDYIKRPLFCQVFDWFREKHEYYIHIEEKYSLNTDIQVYQFRHPDNDKLLKFKTFEEAQLACLDKLIEICEKSSVS